MMEQICQWIASFPGFADYRFSIDRLDSGCHDAGVFFKGMQVLDRQADITGATVTRRRLSLSVLLTAAEGENLADAILEFSPWAEANAPYLGQRQRVSVAKGGIRINDGKGVATYELAIDLDYTTQEDSE